jgi:hypothetical protein
MGKSIQSRTYINVVNSGQPVVVRVQFVRDGTGDVSCSLVDKDQNVALQKALEHTFLFLTDMQGKKIKYDVSASRKVIGSIQVLLHRENIFHELIISGYSKDSIKSGLKSLNGNGSRAR